MIRRHRIGPKHFTECPFCKVFLLLGVLEGMAANVIEKVNPLSSHENKISSKPVKERKKTDPE